MEYFEIPKNPEYNEVIPKLTTETAGHANVWNLIYERIIENIAYIHKAINILKGSGDGSVNKLIAQEVAKIISSAPEDFDTLKEISDWISDHQDSAAAMNTEITNLKNTKLDKTAMADSANIANSFKVPRVNTNVNTIPGVFTGTIKEHINTSENLPSTAYYHIITLEGGDANYATQLAIGMTTTAMFYRNRQNGTWGTWKEISLLTGNILDKNLVIPSYLRVGTNAGNGVELSYNNEGGNIAWFDTEGTKWEQDCFNGNYRLFNYETYKNFIINKNGNASFPADLTVIGDLILKKRLSIGSIIINTDGDIQHVNNKTNEGFGILNNAGGVVFRIGYEKGEAEVGHMGVIPDNNNLSIFYLGGYNNMNLSYPLLKFTQFTNSLQIIPNKPNTCAIGHTEIPFGEIVAKNIYNSSGLITSSDRNKKKEFKDITSELAQQIIDGLFPVSFKYKEGDSGRRHYGLIAQDVEELLKKLKIDSKDFSPLIKHFPNKEVENKDGSKSIVTDYEAEAEYYLRYEGFISLIIKYIQELKKEIESLKEVIS